MPSPHLRKFSDLYTTYGLGAVKNIWLLTGVTLHEKRFFINFGERDLGDGAQDHPAARRAAIYLKLIAKVFT